MWYLINCFHLLQPADITQSATAVTGLVGKQAFCLFLRDRVGDEESNSEARKPYAQGQIGTENHVWLS